jgi:hypothetical protein
VTPYHGALETERVQHFGEVADQLALSILDRFRPIGFAVTALVRLNHAETGVGERTHLMTP